MKRVVPMLVLVFLVLGVGVEAQVPIPAKPNMFPTLTACEEALASGRLRFYEPKYFGLKTQNPANGEDRIVVPLESDTCLEMLVVGGRQFIAQREGTLFRARKLADGSLALYARDDCGNPVYGFVYPAPPSSPLVRRDPPESVEPTRMRSEWDDGAPVAEKKRGFCSSKKCRWTAVLIAGSAAGYAGWRYWPCPPGTVNRYR